MGKSAGKLLRKAIKLHQTSRIQQAEKLYRQVLKLEPANAEAHFHLGLLLLQTGNLGKAEKQFRLTLVRTPHQVNARINLGSLLAMRGQLEEAAQHFYQVLKTHPDHAETHNNLGNVLKDQGLVKKAEEHYRRALSLNPNFANALVNLGSLLQELGTPDEAIRCFHRALEIIPNSADIHSFLGSAYQERGHLKQAHEQYHQALRLAPHHCRAMAGEAQLLMVQGEFERAYKLLKPGIESGTYNFSMITTYTKLPHKFLPRREAIKLLREFAENKSLTTGEKRRLHFRLGKLLDATGAFDQAFDQFARGNALKPRQFEAVDYRQEIAGWLDFLTASRFAALNQSSASSDLPVFIVGMPRSGTSLVEQIISSHPAVFGAGELRYILEIANELTEQAGTISSYPRCLETIDSAKMDHLASRYLEHIRVLGHLDRATPIKRVTDKMPYNYLHLPLIRLMYPRARIIHCRRNELDTCLSIFFQDFGGDHSYAYDLAHIGIYYAEYCRIMRHWQDVLSIPMLEINYEEIVADLETTSRRMIDFIRLDWDDRCLQFYQSERVVKTQSFEQVRNPIYNRSVNRWKNYESHLDALKSSLQQYSEL